MSIQTAYQVMNNMTTGELVRFLVEEMALETPNIQLAKKIGKILKDRDELILVETV